MDATIKLKQSKILKWPLRKYLLKQVDYGTPLDTDRTGKFGFSIKNKNKEQMIYDMKKAWRKANNLAEMPTLKPQKFPFKMGLSI